MDKTPEEREAGHPWATNPGPSQENDAKNCQSTLKSTSKQQL